MQIILSKEEYDALRQKEPKHLERFKQMLKEWRDGMETVFKKYRDNISQTDYLHLVQPMLKDMGRVTDNVVAAWTPPKADEGDL